MSIAVEMLPFQRRISRDPNLPKSRACRNLFGTPDPAEVDQHITSELRKHEEEYRRKYNFDFRNDVPFDGKYEWETCNPQDIPAFYRPSTVPTNGKLLPRRTPSIASEASSGTGSGQRTSVDATCNTNTLPSSNSNFQASLQGLSSPHKQVEETHRDSRTVSSTSCSNSTRTVKRQATSTSTTTGKTGQRKRQRPASNTDKQTQSRITDFLRESKRPAESYKRRKDENNSRTPSPTTKELSS